MKKTVKKGNSIALLPFLVFVVIYLGSGIFLDQQGVEIAFYQFPSVAAMFIAILVAFFFTKGTIHERFKIFSSGIANKDVITMLMIYLLSGAFSSVATAMGGLESTINLSLNYIPAKFLAAGLFLMTGFMGTSTGSSMEPLALLYRLLLEWQVKVVSVLH